MTRLRNHADVCRLKAQMDAQSEELARWISMCDDSTRQRNFADANARDVSVSLCRMVYCVVVAHEVRGCAASQLRAELMRMDTEHRGCITRTALTANRWEVIADRRSDIAAAALIGDVCGASRGVRSGPCVLR
jgi:hypothetical protein